jgi:hypothetical protein
LGQTPRAWRPDERRQEGGGAGRPLVDVGVDGVDKQPIGPDPAGVDVGVDGVDKQPDRLTVARRLAPMIGLTPSAIARRLKALNDNEQAVLRYYQTHGARSRQRRPNTYDGQTYQSRCALSGGFGRGNWERLQRRRYQHQTM